MKILKLGVIGLNLGQWIIECLEGLPQVRLTAVADLAEKIRIPKRGEMTVEAYAAEHGAVPYHDGAEMIKKAELDAVILAVPPKARFSLIHAVAERRLALLIEKPLAANLAEGRELVRLLTEAKVRAMVEYPLRSFPVVQALKGLMDGGTIGRPVSLTAELQTDYNPAATHWMWDPANGNGLLNEAITHLFDTVCFLGGQPKSVCARGGNYRSGAALEDSAGVLIEFDSGMHAVLNGGGLGTRAFNAPLYLRCYGTGGEARLTGSQWMYDHLAWATVQDESPREQAYPPPSRRQIMRHTVERFITFALEPDGPNPCSLDDGLNALRISAAIRRSLTSHEVVEVSTL